MGEVGSLIRQRVELSDGERGKLNTPRIKLQLVSLLNWILYSCTCVRARVLEPELNT